MALSLEADPGPVHDDKKRQALFRLFLILIAIDTLAVAGYLILVFVLGWGGMLPLGLLIIASVLTGIGFQAGTQKIDRM